MHPPDQKSQLKLALSVSLSALSVVQSRASGFARTDRYATVAHRQIPSKTTELIRKTPN
jgi:hypothetical protein